MGQLLFLRIGQKPSRRVSVDRHYHGPRKVVRWFARDAKLPFFTAAATFAATIAANTAAAAAAAAAAVVHHAGEQVSELKRLWIENDLRTLPVKVGFRPVRKRH